MTQTFKALSGSRLPGAMVRRDFPARLACALVLVIVLSASSAHACVGDACMNIWSTADGSGELRLAYDFSAPVQVYESFCTSDRSTCLFSAIEPGFMAPPIDLPPSGLFRITDGTTLRVQIVAIEAGLSLNVNGNKLSQAGESALLGTMPTVHVHPSWQVVIPGSQAGRELAITFKLIAVGATYGESPPISARVQAVAEVEETPTPSPTPTPLAGDCNHDGVVTAEEVVLSVAIATETEVLARCEAADADGDSQVSMDEIQSATDLALTRNPAAFAAVQDLFTRRCATLFCHDEQGRNGNLVLSSGQAHEQLVNVEPDTLSARNQGLLRVAPGDADRSFLLIKVIGPPPSQGSRMPLVGAPLTADEVDLLRAWILQGATP